MVVVYAVVACIIATSAAAEILRRAGIAEFRDEPTWHKSGTFNGTGRDKITNRQAQIRFHAWSTMMHVF